MRLKIVQAGEQVLRQQARALARDEILSGDIQSLVAHMRDTMRDAPGVGLAAPQVGVSVQLAVIEDRVEYHARISPQQLELRKRRPVEFHVVINPRIVSSSEELVEFFEGCLSVSGYTAVVARLSSIAIECLNERAQPVRLDASGWYARILQHEIDHLFGTLYVDRMDPRTFSTIENAERHWREVPTEVVKERLGSKR